MRLISCNIYGFGALNKHTIVFDSRLHSIYGPNGFGKSTLFDFIRVMLYGMPKPSTKKNNFTLRSHYQPFFGQAYGGVLTIDTNEGMISIERKFDPSSSTKDTLKITDAYGNDLTNSKYRNISSLGYHFLGLDVDAYERTVAFRDLTVNEGVGTNETISAKLNSIATSIDVGQYERAIEALDEMKKSLSSKGTKNVGKITRLNQEILSLSSRIRELEKLNETLTGYHQSLTGLKKDHSVMEAEVETARNLNQDLMRWDQYQSKLTEVRQLQQQLQTILDLYPEGIPSNEEVQEIRQLGKQLKTVEIELGTQVFSDSDVATLTLLKERYPNGPIPTSALDRLENAVTERDGNLRVLESNQFLKTQRLEELRDKFRNWHNPSQETLEDQLRKSHDLDHKAQILYMTPIIEAPRTSVNLQQAGIPSEEELQRIEAKANEYKDNQTRIQSLITGLPEKRNLFNKPLLIIGVVLLVIGVVIQLTNIFSHGVIVMLFGLAAMLLAFVFKGTSIKSQVTKQALALQQDNAVLERQLREFFSRYGRYDTDFVAYAKELKESIEEYKRYLSESQRQKQEIQNARSEIASSRSEIENFITSVMGIRIPNFVVGNGYNNADGSGYDTHNTSERNRIGGNDYGIIMGSSDAFNQNVIGSNADGGRVGIGFDIDENRGDSGDGATNCISDSRGLTRLLHDLKDEYKQLLELQKEYDEVERRHKSYEEQIQKYNQEIESIIRQYDIPQEGISVGTLRQESVQLESLTKSFNQYQSRKEELSKSREELSGKLESIYQTLSLSIPEDLAFATAEYEQDQKRSEELKQKIEEKREEAEIFRQSIGLTEEPKVKLTEEELKEKIAKIKDIENQIGRLSDQISQTEQDTSVLPSLVEEKQQKTQELSEAQKELDVVQKTQTFIQQANKNLLDRFVKPILDTYQGQIKQLLPWLESVSMDHTYKITFKKGSDLARNCEHLSSGERTCLELALRLALIENMFHDDCPVLMMDDPFAELDPDNLKKVLEILRGASDKMQVVYFTCSQERVIR